MSHQAFPSPFHRLGTIIPDTLPVPVWVQSFLEGCQRYQQVKPTAATLTASLQESHITQSSISSPDAPQSDKGWDNPSRT